MSLVALAWTLAVNSFRRWIFWCSLIVFVPCGCLVVDNSTSTSCISLPSSSTVTSNASALLRFMDGVVSFYDFAHTSPKHGTSFSTNQQCIKVKLAFQGCFVLYNSNVFCKAFSTFIPNSHKTSKSSNKLIHIMFDNPHFVSENHTSFSVQPSGQYLLQRVQTLSQNVELF
jgi:hypothetical protein